MWLFLAHIAQCRVIAIEWRMYTMNCNHQIGDWKQRKQCQEDTGFCSGRKNLQCLSSTVYSSDFSKHLLFLCSFNNLGYLLFLFLLSCMSLLYVHGYEALTKYVICKYIFFSFHRLSFHFMDGFFYYAESFEFDVVSLVYFCSFCLWFWWLSCLRCLYFGK